MPRTPLKDIQTDDVTSTQMMKQTPDKGRDQAAASTAARLLNSAKKSLTKQCAKRVKLSLKKPLGDAVCSKSSAKGLAFSSKGSDLNDSMEFKGGMPMQTMSKFSLTTRKRKKTIQDNEGKRTKLIHHDPDSGINTSNQNTKTDILEIDPKIKDPTISRTHRLKVDVARNRKNVDVDMPHFDTEQPCSSVSKEDVMAGSHRSLQSESSECDYSEEAHTGDTEEGEGRDRCDKDLSTSLHTCPACGKMLKRGRFVRHIQLCIKQHCDEKDEDNLNHMKDKEALQSNKREATERAHTKSDEDGTESLSSESEYVFCQLCQKDLSHLNSHRRTLHINSCIDQDEKKKEEEKEREQALEAAKTQVLDCPMCGKVLRTLPSRKSHLKKCAANLGVGPDQLLEAVRRQEEQHRATLAAGILPDTGARPGRNTRQNSTSSRRGVGTLPKSKLDEDTQLALALSTSLKPDTVDTLAAPALQPKKGRKKKQ